jgi:hypothetical protein
MATGAAGKQETLDDDRAQQSRRDLWDNSYSSHFVNEQSDAHKREMGQRAESVKNRWAPHAVATKMQATSLAPAALAYANTQDAARQAAGRANQLALASQFDVASRGGGPSVAAIGMRQGMERNLAAQMGATGGMRGNQMLGQRAMGQQAMQTGGATNWQGAEGRMGEQAMAQQGLGGLQSQIRGADLQYGGLNQQLAFANAGASNKFSLAQGGFNQQAALANSGFEQQTGLANAEAQMKQRGQNDQAYQYALERQQALSEQDRQAGINFATQKMQDGQAAMRAFREKQNMTNEKDRAEAQAWTNILSGGFNMLL